MSGMTAHSGTSDALSGTAYRTTCPDAMPAFDQCPAWQALREHHLVIAGQHMRDWFASPQAIERVEQFSLSAAGLYLDYSKNRITGQTRALLVKLARERGVAEQREAMWAGELLNHTEKRAALHVALRAPLSEVFRVAGVAVGDEVHATLARMRHLCAIVHGGHWRGGTGKRIRHVIHVGIGGSDLGPRIAYEALAAHADMGLSVHFIANIDPTEMARVLPTLDPQAALVVVCSKTFSTQETMANARAVRMWLTDGGVAPSRLGNHMIAVTSNPQAAIDFGVRAENVLAIGEWVGGRYSLWSAVGLSVMLGLGAARFDELLAGAHAMDEHFRTQPFEANMPVLLALIGVWYRNFFGAQTLCIAPYAQALSGLPSYLQQLDMESNGKSVQRNATPVSWDTAPVLWGMQGTNAQHAYFQMLHQGTSLVPVDFIAVRKPVYVERPIYGEHHQQLLAHCFAQSQALMQGCTEMTMDEAISQGLAHRYFGGNRPSNTLLLDSLSPFSLGALLALYEHKVFVQAVLWGVSPFDQWGVELGKTLGGRVASALQMSVARNRYETAAMGVDASTAKLIGRVQQAGALAIDKGGS